MTHSTTGGPATDRASAVIDFDHTDIEMDEREAVCTDCRLVYWRAAGAWGVCPDCVAGGALDEALRRCPTLYALGA